MKSVTKIILGILGGVAALIASNQFGKLAGTGVAELSVERQKKAEQKQQEGCAEARTY